MIHHTTRLYYRRYTHQLNYRGASGSEILAWANEVMPRRFRKYIRKTHGGHPDITSLYCNRIEHDMLLASGVADPCSSHIPVDEEAEALLLSGVKLDIRERTYWNRFRYVMRFWTRSGEMTNLYQFLHDRLGKPGTAYKVVRSKFFPNVYLRDDSQLAMLRLSDPPARLVETVRVYTHAELSKSIR